MSVLRSNTGNSKGGDFERVSAQAHFEGPCVGNRSRDLWGFGLI